jgi:hypothetical protein
MKKAILQTERLLQFAKHLRGLEKNYTGGYYDIVELIEVDMKIRIHYKMKYDLCILMQLPSAFPNDWYFYDGTAIPLLKGKSIDDGPISCFCLWFGTDPAQTCTLIDIEGCQDELYRGVVLNMDSSPEDYAQNFEALAVWAQNQTNS